MGSWWVHDLWNSGQRTELVSWIFWVILSICLHELGHGVAAIRQGDRTPIERGHMTLNPLVHMGPVSLIVFAFIGIAWGLMPVDPSRFRDGRRGRAKVALAGPAVNIGLALVTLTGAALLYRYAGPNAADPQALTDHLFIFLLSGGWLNILLAIFNMLPVPPLDGSQVLAGLSMRFYIWMQNPQFQMVGLFLFLALFLSGIGGVIFGVAIRVSWGYIDLVSGVLP